VTTVADDGSVSLFVVNRSTTDEAALSVGLAGRELVVEDAQTLTVPPGGDRFTSNTQDAQPVAPVVLDAVAREVADGFTRLRISLPPISWSVLTLRPATPSSEASHA